jgi:hypothetical protein
VVDEAGEEGVVEDEGALEGHRAKGFPFQRRVVATVGCIIGGRGGLRKMCIHGMFISSLKAWFRERACNLTFMPTNASK